jgi:putative oxidoreductase
VLLHGHKVAPGFDKFFIGAVIELVAGVLIFIGLFTRCAAFVACGEMAVAYFTVHAKNGFFPIVNGGELAVIYCFVALFIACRGAGRLGIDRS